MRDLYRNGSSYALRQNGKFSYATGINELIRVFWKRSADSGPNEISVKIIPSSLMEWKQDND